MITVTVDAPSARYDVLIGLEARHRLLEVLPVGAERAAIITQEDIGVHVDSGIEQRVFTIPNGEKAKCLEVVEELCSAFARWGMTRNDVVVCVGGGVVTDVGGFVAAVYHRGIGVVHVPTTLLAQIDAAIGGKTGVNLPEGKNLVGAIKQPVAVLCDTDVLSALPPREYRSGLGEMAKYHFLGTGSLDDLPLDERIARCVELKAAVVGEDEQDLSGARALLNYGHTLGHALETSGSYDLRHGEAVAIGLLFAARLAQRLGRIDSARVEEHMRVLKNYDLPMEIPAGLGDEELVKLMRGDKKATNKGLTFVLDGPRHLEVVNNVPEDAVLATLKEMHA